MVIDQRNAGASVTPTVDNTYTLDRWKTRLSQASKFSVQQSSVAPAGFVNSLLVTSLSAYSVTSTDFFQLLQVVEGFNAADLGWGTANAQTITISFLVRSSLTGTFSGVISNELGNRVYGFSYVVSAANTFEQKTITIPGDTTGTWATNSSGGLFLFFTLGAGSSTTGSAGAWGSTFIRGVTGTTSVVGTNGATFYVTGVQLEKGSTATSFDYRPYGTELALCQRYFETIDASMRAYTSDGFFAIPAVFKVTKRATPTVTWVSNTTSNLSGAPASVGTQTVNNYSAQWSGLSAGTYYAFPTSFTVASEL
jgi:hypothetical protein